MLGFSLYLSDPVDELVEERIVEMKKAGFSGIFSSLHIPEDDPAIYYSQLSKLGRLAMKYEMNLMVDVSAGALEKAGFSSTNLSEIRKLGITGLRLDDGFSLKQIAEASHKMSIGLNASTLVQKQLNELRENNADFNTLSAWHNYYPRPNTGLDREWFIQKNKWLKKEGLTVQAFVPGDKELRGPLFEGLPTLENHRGNLPLVGALDLKQCAVDLIYIGDKELSEESLLQFTKWKKENVIQLRCQLLEKDDLFSIIDVHHNRPDVSRDVVRSRESRYRLIGKEIPQTKCLKRKIGAITLDNHLYGRYQGELQICKKELPADEKVNVLGFIRKEDCKLLSFIDANVGFELKLEGEVKDD